MAFDAKPSFDAPEQTPLEAKKLEALRQIDVLAAEKDVLPRSRYFELRSLEIENKTPAAEVGPAAMVAYRAELSALLPKMEQTKAEVLAATTEAEVDAIAVAKAADLVAIVDDIAVETRP